MKELFLLWIFMALCAVSCEVSKAGDQITHAIQDLVVIEAKKCP